MKPAPAAPLPLLARNGPGVRRLAAAGADPGRGEACDLGLELAPVLAVGAALGRRRPR